jgi:hypothetical protein
VGKARKAHKTHLYTVGGTIPPGQIYIQRQADDELLALCRAGTLAYVLSTRQVGKSSLMVPTAQKLEAEGTRCALADLSLLGSQFDDAFSIACLALLKAHHIKQILDGGQIMSILCRLPCMKPIMAQPAC